MNFETGWGHDFAIIGFSPTLSFQDAESIYESHINGSRLTIVFFSEGNLISIMFEVNGRLEVHLDFHS